jgi:hypothetical protein
MTMTKLSRRILRLLKKAPSPASELAVLLEVPRRRVQIRLWVLRRGGWVQKAGLVPNSDNGRGHHPRVTLWRAYERTR